MAKTIEQNRQKHGAPMLENNTRQQVEKIFLQVSRDAARKKLYAIRAEQEGNSQLARLYRAIALSEETQATRFLLQLRGQIGNSSINIAAAFNREIPALSKRYNQAINVAVETGERAMESAFTQSEKVARIHLNLKKKLDKSPNTERSYHVCRFCGFIMEETAPDTCPICTAAAERFTKA